MSTQAPRTFDQMPAETQAEYRQTVRRMGEWDLKNKLHRLSTEGGDHNQIASYLRVCIEIADARGVKVSAYQRAQALDWPRDGVGDYILPEFIPIIIDTPPAR